MEFLVDLNKVEDVKTFVRFAELYDTDIIVRNQDKKFAIDGSSIMGLFSLDLSRLVVVHIEDVAIGERFKNDVVDFVVE